MAMNDRNRLAGIALAAILLAGCATLETPYQPAREGRGYGYTDQKLESNRYRVRFVGNDSTDREVVENYLLYRAAELTLQHGYDYFVVADQGTEAQRYHYQSLSGGFGGWGRYYWGPRMGLGVGYGIVDAATEYEGSMEVVMFKGKKKESEVKAFNAAEVKQNLEPEVWRPERERK
jgi:hypothetical protein